MQGEAGIIIPPPGYLKKVSEICKKNNVLLILDEIQTGLCRTGKMFAFEHENIVPDAVIIGKALGGGILLISAFGSHAEVMDLFTPGSHGSSFGQSISIGCRFRSSTYHGRRPLCGKLPKIRGVFGFRA
jgi:ornithine--oxo-acid transaminase